MGNFVSRNRDNLQTEEDVAFSYCKSIERPHRSLEKRNNRVAALLKASILLLFLALLVLVVVAIYLMVA